MPKLLHTKKASPAKQMKPNVFLAEWFRKELLLSFFDKVFDFFRSYYFFPEGISARFGVLYRDDHFGECFGGTLIAVSGNGFLSHGSVFLGKKNYLISLWMVYFRKMGLYFFNSRRPGVLRRFLVVI
jgi:hypothetical protein